ncbi:MAG: hypothetical protein HY909_20450 [Deltaproteobacteria bacterium]|nr:hypothetical protein [Deltaproteobacteria bacterium]
MATPDPRHAYVRFYLQTLHEIDGAARAVASTEASLRAQLQPFADALRECGGSALLAAPEGLPSTAGQWRPADPEHLTGLTDVYEVVGRFTFQGDDDQNVNAVGAVLQGLRAEVSRQRDALKDLAEAPARLRARAEHLEQQDLASARSSQEGALKQFEPEAVTLRKLCTSLLDALRAVKAPDLSRLDTAEALYQDHVSRLRGLYAKALPYLRSSLADLSRVAGCEVPPSWPDALPFAPSLPPEYVTAPPGETPQLLQARQDLDAFTQHEAALARAVDELGVQLRRCEGEAQALASRTAEVNRELALARLVVRHAQKLDEIDHLRAQGASAAQEALARGARVAQYGTEHGQLTAALQQAQAEATEWARKVPERELLLQQHREAEPALFGKDEWRRKLDDLEGELSDARTELARRQQGLQAANAELARLRALAEAEQGTISALQRAQDELRARETALQSELRALESELGASRPMRRLTVAQAEETVTALQSAGNEVRARAERLSAEQRRIKEEADRGSVQARQVTAEKQKLQAAVAQAAQAAQAALDEALRALSQRRQAAFELHLRQVVEALEDSLANVDRVFIDPARRVLLERAGVLSAGPGALRQKADALAGRVPELVALADSGTAPALATVERLEVDFVARAPAACRAAW